MHGIHNYIISSPLGRPQFGHNGETPLGSGIGSGAVIALGFHDQPLAHQFLRVHAPRDHINNPRWFGVSGKKWMEKGGQQVGAEKKQRETSLEAFAGLAIVVKKGPRIIDEHVDGFSLVQQPMTQPFDFTHKRKICNLDNDVFTAGFPG